MPGYERLAPVTYTGPQIKFLESLLQSVANDSQLRKYMGLDRRDLRLAEAALERTKKAIEKRANKEQRKLEKDYPSFKAYIGGQQKVESAEKPDRPKPTLLWANSK